MKPRKPDAEARRRAVGRAVEFVEALFPLAFGILVLVLLAGLLEAL